MAENLKGNAFIKECIFDALVLLMQERPLREISITDITRRANVSRMAYYRNYSSKEDILRDRIDGLLEEYYLFSNLDPGQDHHTSKKNIAQMLTVCQKQQAFILACDQAGLGHYIGDAIYRYLSLHFSNDGADPLREYCLSAYAGSIYSVVLKWLTDDCRADQEALTELLYNIYGQHI